MSLRILLRSSRCSPSLRTWRSTPVQTTYPWQLSVAGSAIWVRGAKTKTVVKASSLPQGVLPPVLKDPTDNAPAKQYSAVLQQHLNNVRKFKDCVVLTRVGDFYEMYFDQVDQYAHLVNLKKAKRSTALGDVAMAGFQYTALDRYLKMFVQDLGLQVAISEQIKLSESEKEGRAGAAMYDRRVTRIVTAGTLIDENFMDPYENNYLLAVHIEGGLPAERFVEEAGEAYERYRRNIKVGLAWVDLSSGHFFTQSSDLAGLATSVARIGPREVVMNQDLEVEEHSRLIRLLGDGAFSIHFQSSGKHTQSVTDWTSMLERPVAERDIDAFLPAEVAAGSLVLDYVREKLLDQQIQLQPPVRRSDDEYMSIDRQSLRGLEIKSTLRDGTFQGSLLHAMRQTVTKSGARLLSQRLVSPSLSLSVIDDRLDLVQELLHDDALREDVVALLRRTTDTLRLLQRFAIGKGDADDLLSLAKTIDVMGRLSGVLHDHIISQQECEEAPVELGFMWDILARLDLDGPAKVARNITNAIDEEGLNRQHVAELEEQGDVQELAEEVIHSAKTEPTDSKSAKKSSKQKQRAAETTSNEIWIMRKHASPALKKAHSTLDELMDSKIQLARRLRTELGAGSLTLRWSAQYGHFCHVKGKDAKGQLSAYPGVRSIGSTKSTQSFYLSDWTHLGVRIDASKLYIRTEENEVFSALRTQLIQSLMKLRRNASVLDELDVACSSATVAKQRGLVRPIFNSSTSHRIVGGRHPTVDASLKGQGRLFTPNDCAVGDEEKIYLITGPNMAGKSTYLRQNALITILAQTGCFVPADYAEIGLVDKIFSRVGSADNLYQDQSTFMVEMLETAEILKQATPRSFVIMDEVGRGTTPEDGVAVGYACLHHLHNVNKCRTLFATHFHALADMTQDFEALGRYCTDVEEDDTGSWAYVHQLRKGVNRKSHALKVARLAGLPEQAVNIAGEVLASLPR